MPQTANLIQTLKRALKANGKTYADVAEQLQLSEASIKRLFAEQSLSLQRLDQICQLIQLEISDLVQIMNEQGSQQLTGLSIEQEQEIANDLELLLVTVCVLNRWTLEDLVDYFHFTEPRCINHLAKLDRLQLIELLPKNRIKLLVAPNFRWQENGPIQRFFLEKLGADFFNSRFRKESEQLIVINGMLAESSNAVFQKKMRLLAKAFDELNNDDAGLPIDQRTGTTVVLALRNWRYGIFDQYTK
ncbi:MAG: helix-turn-helix transcriptional regulator [Gammaproteobacteria bacterium]|nr:helix-turn-helix transcriptional regulator [Gammaproteobacteria bacterium]